MGRLLAIDYGVKRVGVAVTDPERIIATPLTTINASETMSFLKDYFNKEEVDVVVVGEPRSLDMKETDATLPVRKFVEGLKADFPNLKVVMVNEQFTSKMAMDSMISGGASKQARREKGNLDKVSAALILQHYMNSSKYHDS